MATVLGTPYSPPSPPDTSSSATMSPVYPDRPIRPLPKRSLRERLSPEVADQIPFPPAPISPETMFSNLQYSTPKTQREVSRLGIQDVDRALIDAQEGYEESYDSISMISRYRELNEKGIPVPNTNSHGMGRAVQPIARSVTSSNESIDGYDSFENTNNKKKRKIPVPGGPGSYNSNLSTSLSNDLANMGISASYPPSGEVGSPIEDGHDGMSYGTGNAAMLPSPSGTGISGAGRGRYGRSGRRDGNGRSPLGVATGNGSANRQSGRMYSGRRDISGTSPLADKGMSTDHGIISAAIAEAATSPVMPSKGQENISLLDQQLPTSGGPVKSQFTFTCESDTTKAMSWPGDHHLYESTAAAPYDPRDFNTQATQTSPMAGSTSGVAGGSQQGVHPNAAAPSGSQPAPAARKPRRSPAKRYAIAARDRRLQQEYNNYHHPPREDEVWICEFCEYESIFGRPPEALVRQYEIKDRRERKRLAEKRRLLEKAKMKGRKNKKATKNAGKNSAANHASAANAGAQHGYAADKTAQQAHHHYDHDHDHDHDHDDVDGSSYLHTHDGHSDDYYDHDHDHEHEHDHDHDYEDGPSLPPLAPPEIPSRIPLSTGNGALHHHHGHGHGHGHAHGQGLHGTTAH